jgi:hypothetical protein
MTTESRVQLSPEDRAELEGWVAGRNTPQKLVWWARIVLTAATLLPTMLTPLATMLLAHQRREAIKRVNAEKETLGEIIFGRGRRGPCSRSAPTVLP